MYLQPKVKPENARLQGITLISFAFRHGRVETADILLDIRDIISSDSIYYGETGKEPRIINLVRGYDNFIAGIEAIVRAAFTYNGGRPLVVAIGCTHGRHRSVALAEILKEKMPDLPVTIIHRDLK